MICKLRITNYEFGITKLLVLLFIIHFSLFTSIAQEITVSAKFDSSNVITIGDQLKLHIQAKVPKFAKITWPNIQDTLTKQIEVVSKTIIDTSLASDSETTVLSQTLFITSFDSGYWAIPPFQFSGMKGYDTLKLETDPLLIQVNTLAVDTTQAIKDIKEPLDIPLSWEEIAPYIIGGLILLAILILAFYFYRKYQKRPKPLVIEKKIAIPPHVTALQRLEELKQKQLWQNNQVKEYHALLSEISREYLEKRYHFNALEFTTDEVLQAIRNVSISSDEISKLKQVLVLSDLVKFAKEQPLPNENELSMNNAIEFINKTKENTV